MSGTGRSPSPCDEECAYVIRVEPIPMGHRSSAICTRHAVAAPARVQTE